MGCASSVHKRDQAPVSPLTTASTGSTVSTPVSATSAPPFPSQPPLPAEQQQISGLLRGGYDDTADAVEWCGVEGVL
jgi:hypothetical protein